VAWAARIAGTKTVSRSGACRVVGVQSSAAPAAYLSWRRGELTGAGATTSAAGLATCAGYALPQGMLRGRLDDFRLVTDQQIRAAIGVLARDAHTLAEGAGAAGLAALLADPAPPARCAVVVTGGNASDEELAALGRPGSGPDPARLTRMD
jgi:threonine dehydratase